VLAHVGGVPLEEALLPLAGGAGAGLLLARAWVGTLVRRARLTQSRAESHRR
jgi:hypothetical protein